MGERRSSAAMSRVVAVVPAVIVVVSLTAGPASASDIIGFTFVPSAFCGSVATTIVETAPPAGKSYVVTHPGVITSWSFQASASPPELEFKAFRPAGGSSYTVLGSSLPTTPPADAFSTFPVRIPVAAGDILGETYLANGQCASVSGGVASLGGDPPSGSTAVYNPNGNGTYDISAVVEPDADGDGYGDESQDGCSSQAASHGPCDLRPPVTKVTSAPKRTGKSTVKVRFSADEAGVTFECRIKGKGAAAQLKRYHPCSSPLKVKHLSPGTYKVYVRATDVVGNVGKPAKKKFVVQRKT